MSKPQPMNTAPKDRPVLAWWPYPGRWEYTTWDKNEFAKRTPPRWDSFTIGHLWGKREMSENQPTHWLPMPEPPK